MGSLLPGLIHNVSASEITVLTTWKKTHYHAGPRSFVFSHQMSAFQMIGFRLVSEHGADLLRLLRTDHLLVVIMGIPMHPRAESLNLHSGSLCDT